MASFDCAQYAPSTAHPTYPAHTLRSYVQSARLIAADTDCPVDKDDCEIANDDTGSTAFPISWDNTGHGQVTITYIQ
jgi:hypothetical protein